MSDPKKTPTVPDGKKETTPTVPATLPIQEPPTPAHAEALKIEQDAITTNNQNMQKALHEAAEQAARILKKSAGKATEVAGHVTVAVGMSLNPVAAQAPKSQPAIIEVQDVAGTKQQLDAFLLSRKLERFGPQFEALSQADQSKVLAYFIEGKKYQPDEKILGKGVVNYIMYLALLAEDEKMMDYYEKNGKLPEQDNTSGSLMGHAKFILAGFQGANAYISAEKSEQIDNLILDWYRARTAQTEARTAQTKKDIEFLTNLKQLLLTAKK